MLRPGERVGIVGLPAKSARQGPDIRSVHSRGMDRTEFATKAAMPQERRSKIDTAIIAVAACTAGGFVAGAGHHPIAALAVSVFLAGGLALASYIIKGG